MKFKISFCLLTHKLNLYGLVECRQTLFSKVTRRREDDDDDEQQQHQDIVDISNAPSSLWTKPKPTSSMASQPHRHCGGGRGGTSPLHHCLALSRFLRHHHQLLAPLQELGSQPPFFSPLGLEQPIICVIITTAAAAAAHSVSQSQPFRKGKAGRRRGVVTETHRIRHRRVLATLDSSQGVREALVAASRDAWTRVVRRRGRRSSSSSR